MEPYFFVKLVHVISSTVLFGTGLGIAYFFWTAHRSRDIGAIALVSRQVVIADAIFTAPAVVVQPVTGWWLATRLGLPLDTPWIAASLALYVLVGACWLPVVWLQWRMAKLATAALDTGTPLPATYFRYARYWFALGWPALVAMLAIFALMVVKRLP